MTNLKQLPLRIGVGIVLLNHQNKKPITILEEIREQINFELLIIGAQINLGKLEGQCVKWSVENEQKYIKKIDIGLMPLPINHWTKGKCGLKAIQYSNFSIPASTNVSYVVRKYTPYNFAPDSNLAARFTTSPIIV